MKVFQKLLRDERGMETVEWAILAALIVTGLAAIITVIGQHVSNAFTTLQNATAS